MVTSNIKRFFEIINKVSEYPVHFVIDHSARTEVLMGPPEMQEVVGAVCLARWETGFIIFALPDNSPMSLSAKFIKAVVDHHAANELWKETGICTGQISCIYIDDLQINFTVPPLGAKVA